MNLLEKVSYIRGLMDGLALDEKEPVTKVVNEIVNVLEDMAVEIEDMDVCINELDEYIGEIDEDLEAVEDYLEECDEDYYDDCDCDCDCEDDFYAVVCSNCKEKFYVDDDTAQKGDLKCPNCNETIKFNLSDCDDCDCCDCDK